MVRDKEYSLVAKTDGSDAKLTRYKGPFDGKQLEDSGLTKDESSIKEQFEAKIAELAKTLPLGRQQASASQIGKPQKNPRKRARNSGLLILPDVTGTQNRSTNRK